MQCVEDQLNPEMYDIDEVKKCSTNYNDARSKDSLMSDRELAHSEKILIFPTIVING